MYAIIGRIKHMIPKKIHYVWVGGNDKPADIKRCMSTWKNHLSDYEIIEWNEDNFDIDSHPYAKAAYEEKKWAYVSDYIRAYVIYKEGGIYLDTDVLVLDNFDRFLENRAFVGYETPDYPFTAVFGAEKQHPLVEAILNYYEGPDFKFDRKNQMAEVNTKSVSDILIQEFGCALGNKRQTLRTGIEVYTEDVLCNPSKNSTTIHVFTGTWMEGTKPLMRKINKFLKLRLTSRAKAGAFRRFIMKNK